jgi:hypothetical protein
VQSPWFQILTTILGIIVTDAWKCMKYGLGSKQPVTKIRVVEFASALAHAILEKYLLNGLLSTPVALNIATAGVPGSISPESMSSPSTLLVVTEEAEAETATTGPTVLIPEGDAPSPRKLLTSAPTASSGTEGQRQANSQKLSRAETTEEPHLVDLD